MVRNSIATAVPRTEQLVILAAAMQMRDSFGGPGMCCHLRKVQCTEASTITGAPSGKGR